MIESVLAYGRSALPEVNGMTDCRGAVAANGRAGTISLLEDGLAASGGAGVADAGLRYASNNGWGKRGSVVLQ